MSRGPALIAMAFLMLAAGCRDSGESDYFAIDGKIFVFNYRVATATYLINIRPLKPVGEGETAVARFEDPAGGPPIVVRKKIWPRLDKTTIESPPLRCVAKERPYAVSIAIEGPDGTVMQTLETTMASTDDQSLLPDRPLVVGPFYTPNPELVGRPNGKLDVTNEADCPAPRPTAG